MNCAKCSGRMFVDRTFSENKNYELFCIICGARTFINKNTEFGRWLHQKEKERETAAQRKA